MCIYLTKSKKLTGRHRKIIYDKAMHYYKNFLPKTKRKPYLRSQYFNNEKIFFDIFWDHLKQKRQAEQTRRLRFLPAALELIKNTHYKPTSKQNPNRLKEILHRFTGSTIDGEVFFVQIKENMNNQKKYLVSIFPKK